MIQDRILSEKGLQSEKFRTALSRPRIMRDWLQMCDGQFVSVPFLRVGAFIHSAANSLRDLRRTKRKGGIEYCQTENEAWGLDVMCMQWRGGTTGR